MLSHAASSQHHHRSVTLALDNNHNTEFTASRGLSVHSLMQSSQQPEEDRLLSSCFAYEDVAAERVSYPPGFHLLYVARARWEARPSDPLPVRKTNPATLPGLSVVGQEYHPCSKRASALVVGTSQLKWEAILLPPAQQIMLSCLFLLLFSFSQSNPKCREHCDYLVWKIFSASQLINSHGALMPFVTWFRFV